MNNDLILIICIATLLVSVGILLGIWIECAIVKLSGALYITNEDNPEVYIALSKPLDVIKNQKKIRIFIRNVEPRK